MTLFMDTNSLGELKVVALAGGVGGAKLAYGLAQILPGKNLTVVVNTGDDFDHFGLRICPDLDTVCYSLAGLANPISGWGMVDDTFTVLSALKALGAPTWFSIGDKDMATHLERTRRLSMGESLSEVTRYFTTQWGIKHHILPMTDDTVRTMIMTKDEHCLAFQEYFVHQACKPEVKGFIFEGIDRARPAPGLLESINLADLIVICPSNPWVSIDPIIGIRDIKDALCCKTVVAVSPIVGGKAQKGPAAKMFSEMGIAPTATSVMMHYNDLLTGFILDNLDSQEVVLMTQCNIIPYVTNTIMHQRDDKVRLAAEVLDFGRKILLGEVYS